MRDSTTPCGSAPGDSAHLAEGHQRRFRVTPANQLPHQLGSDSDVNDTTTSGDDGFDTDTQQETVVGSHPAYQDLRQFAMRQLQRKDPSPIPAAAAADAASDTDSSSSSSHPLRRSGSGSVTASPVLSDGRLTPRRQYTSYVLITQENKTNSSTSSSSAKTASDVISDDESGVTVTLPPTTPGCVVEVPADPSASDSWTGTENNASDSETNEESSSCVTISGNGVLTDQDVATSDDDLTITERGGDSKLAKYFTFELESGSNYRDSRKQPVVYKNQPAERSSPDPYRQESGQEEEADEEDERGEGEEEDVSFASSIDEQSHSIEQDTLQYESDPSESRLDSMGDDAGDGESLYSESGASSCDEVYMDQEEELRGYNRAIDFTLHTILEESCEESDGERRSRCERTRAGKETSELEKYFTHGLGSGDQEPKRRTSFANEESEYSDTFSETSSSIYSEGRSGGEEEEDVDPVELASSRLEKYFRTNFLGLEPASHRAPGAAVSDASDSSESVGSDSEGHASPEQQRRKKLMKTRGLRQQTPRDADDAPPESVDAEASSGEDDDDEGEEEEIVMEKDGQFDTIKRRKKKRSATDASNQHAVEKQMAAVEELSAQQVNELLINHASKHSLELLYHH